MKLAMMPSTAGPAELSDCSVASASVDGLVNAAARWVAPVRLISVCRLAQPASASCRNDVPELLEELLEKLLDVKRPLELLDAVGRSDADDELDGLVLKEQNSSPALASVSRSRFRDGLASPSGPVIVGLVGHACHASTNALACMVPAT